MKKLFGSKKEIKPLPYPCYWWPVFLLALGGLADSVYLFYAHYKNYTDILYKSFCALTKAINCDTVSQSEYSVFLGLPVAVWGILGYLGYLTLVFFARNIRNLEKHIWSVLFLVALLFTLNSIVLALIAIFRIQSYCIMCILSYLINFFLLFYAWIIRSRFEKTGLVRGTGRGIRCLLAKRRSFLPVCASIGLAAILLQIYLPVYWQIKMPVLSSNVKQGMTDDGHPWIGAENPELEILEFTDYYCFQCRKMHHYLREILENNPDKIRIVHRNFPMDHEFNYLLKTPVHTGAGNLALLAIRAAEMNDFWTVNDLLYQFAEKKDFDVRELSEKTGLNAATLAGALHSKAARFKLKREIAEGLKLGVRGTPSYIINGELHPGLIPPDILKKYLEQE